MSVEIKGMSELTASLGGIPKQIDAANKAFLYRASLLVQRDARANAPRSPLQYQINSARKTTRNTSSRKNGRATSRAKPGGIERSIERLVKSDSAIVFVASNSEAGGYAEKMHDEKGKTWSKRGIGTIAKGSRADSKFIERALDENKENIKRILESEMRKIKL